MVEKNSFVRSNAEENFAGRFGDSKTANFAFPGRPVPRTCCAAGCFRERALRGAWNRSSQSAPAWRRVTYERTGIEQLIGEGMEVSRFGRKSKIPFGAAASI